LQNILCGGSTDEKDRDISNNTKKKIKSHNSTLIECTEKEKNTIQKEKVSHDNQQGKKVNHKAKVNQTKQSLIHFIIQRVE
jgi:hypothetical protein